MNSEWFQINEKYKIFESIKQAHNLQEAFDKCSEKWKLIKIGYMAINGILTCGLCDLFFIRHCKNCPAVNCYNNTPLKKLLLYEWKERQSEIADEVLELIKELKIKYQIK